MTDSEDEPRKGARRHLVDLAPLKESPAFARLFLGGAVSLIGAQMSVLAVGLQIYDITGSTFMVGLVGGVSLVPMIIAGLWGGMLADALDRRRLLIVASLVSWASTLALLALALWDLAELSHGGRAQAWPFLVVTTVNSVAATIGSATRSALVGRIMPPHLVSRASALNGIAIGVGVTIGPALAGVLVASAGFAWTYAADALLFTAGFLGIWTLPSLPRLGERAEVGWAMLREGAHFLRHAPNLRMSFIVDIIAMTFARPYVLMPAIGATVVGGGSLSVGMLTAAGAIGTMLTSVFSGPVARVHRHGLAITRAITAFGAFAVLFGAAILVLSLGDHQAAAGWSGIHWGALAVLAFAMLGMGASDEVSAIFRSTMMIQAAPDEMRGRMQGVFVVVVTGGPRVGDMYAGILATAVALWFPPLLGGLVIIALIAVLTRVGSSFREYDARHPTP
ncbi:MFS transporter [Demequina capsici]|uniref:Multidrug efflux pump Tap n=1 Tax=Demequina capsici TaxID=3075620 RepID=A0AA96FET3_9MICO|nr:MFS transporter [Demequina sp. PMTSA13]WNM28204.1 MFS transporter [Demequina sp. PMTSA13]